MNDFLTAIENHKGTTLGIMLFIWIIIATLKAKD